MNGGRALYNGRVDQSTGGTWAHWSQWFNNIPSVVPTPPLFVSGLVLCPVLHVTLHVACSLCVPLPSPTEDASCEFGSSKYYALCGFGGILSCGVTHTAMVPLDLVKCRLQVCKEATLSTSSRQPLRRMLNVPSSV